MKEMLVSKKVTANIVEEEDPVDSFLSSFSNKLSEPPILDLQRYDNSSLSAATSLPLHVIYPSFGEDVKPECILDSGAQIVVMRRDIWEKLEVPMNSTRATKLESANAQTTSTLGLIEDLRLQISPLVVYLQVQVVPDTPFEVLLGRPFFDVTSCSDVSTSGGSHEIRLRDPKTRMEYTFNTHPRPPRSPPSSAVNFRA